MIQHRQRNRILSVQNEEGERIVEQEGIEKVLVKYHKEILSEPQTDREKAIETICKVIPKIITEEQNKALMRAATMEEVEEIVMSMKKGIAPGPDGYTMEFYQAGWHFLGKEILELVEESHLKQKVWPAINSSFFTLIPKSTNSENAQGFRPIALCNVIYKIIATLIAKGLKPLLVRLISPDQTGFVEGRKILDGLVVTQEVIHSVKMKKQKGMMIKLDLSKAYDRLNWTYLKKVLESFGFNNRWIEWIFNLISTPNFSILINGTPSTTFNATRGIRQGDPLSPFLFIMAAEGLGRYFKKELQENKIKGLRLWGNNLPITHQQFVDDIMLFGEATLKEVRNIKRILDLFVEASGMEINKEKSCTFIFNTLDSIKAYLTRTLGFRQGELPTKYLGNQLDINPKNLGNWQKITKKLRNKMASWTFRSLNIAGRLVLLKSILQAIPIYPLSIMAAPQGACTKIKEIYGKFIWGGPNQQRKWALVSWKSLTKRKEEGGLGLRYPKKLNKVLGAKLWWRWMRGGNDLWKEIWRHKYNMPKKMEEILRLEETPKGSTIWDLASQNRELVNKHAFWERRGGREARFWEKWQQRDKLNSIQSLQNMQQNAVRDNREYVKDYWKEGETDGIWLKWKMPEEWDENIDQEQQQTYLKEVESRKIKVRTREDIVRWGKSTKGTFTIKEAYYLMRQQEGVEENTEWKTIWDNKWWPKITLFSYLLQKLI